ncbi:hypothetical protein BGZ83_009811 [Gryganskiella cystojenkinii]|nr:hypothetical protein BGZ83_009811 [Gryganskiella cystojenkinii]
MPTSPPPMTGAEPSMQLFNPSEQRYFSEFLDTLVVDQDFTFDPSSIPNLPNLPLFSPETMPGGLGLESTYMQPVGASSSSSSQQHSQQQLQHTGMMHTSHSMDFDMTSPSSQSSFGNGGANMSTHYNRGGGYSPQQQLKGDSPASPGSPSHYTNGANAPVSVPAKRKTNKANNGVDTLTRKGTPASQMDSSKISTPIQQLSKLSLNNSSNNNSNGANGEPSNPKKKNKRADNNDEDSNQHHHQPPTPTSATSPSRRSRDQQHEERTRSVSEDGSVSDAANGGHANGTNGNGTTTKRKPYKELLTEEEKRANHIASEQKRRNTIRNGFKDMTDIIPDLKDVNSSKSTILFKAVDFIKHLEKRNRVLQEKASLLESRLMTQRGGSSSLSSSSSTPPSLHHTNGHLNNNPGLDDKRLQDIPHIYPVSCSR